MSRISRRVAAIAPSATIAVDTRAKMLKSMGEKVVNFGAGEPDFPTPDDVVEAAAAACTDPRNHKYTPIPGLPELRQAVAAKAARESRLAVHPAQVLVTNGAKQAVFTAYAVLVDPGDEVLLPAPYWTTYPEAIALSGGVPVPVMADETTGFKVSVEQLEAARTPRTKALNFVSPSNPTGAVYSRDEIIAIGRWAAEHDVYVVTDEIYEHLVYAGARHFSMPALVGELEDRCLVVSGVAKSYSMTGWRVGWMIGPRDLVDAGANLQSHLSSNVANVSQRAALAALLGGLDSVKEMREAFDRRRRRMHEMLSAMPGVTCIEPQGAFYAFPSFKEVLGREIAGQRPETTLELCELVLEAAKVAIVPGEAFGAPGYARLSYALGDDDLVEGLTRLGKLIAA